MDIDLCHGLTSDIDVLDLLRCNIFSLSKFKYVFLPVNNFKSSRLWRWTSSFIKKWHPPRLNSLLLSATATHFCPVTPCRLHPDLLPPRMSLLFHSHRASQVDGPQALQDPKGLLSFPLSTYPRPCSPPTPAALHPKRPTCLPTRSSPSPRLLLQLSLCSQHLQIHCLKPCLGLPPQLLPHLQRVASPPPAHSTALADAPGDSYLTGQMTRTSEAGGPPLGQCVLCYRPPDHPPPTSFPEFPK